MIDHNPLYTCESSLFWQWLTRLPGYAADWFCDRFIDITIVVVVVALALEFA